MMPTPKELFDMLVDNMAAYKERPCLECDCGQKEVALDIIKSNYGQPCKTCGKSYMLGSAKDSPLPPPKPKKHSWYNWFDWLMQ